jgi:lambda family phage minor tail protein L
MSTLEYDFQQPDVGELVILYSLDLTSLGGSILCFTENTVVSGTTRSIVKFGGTNYFPLDIESDGWAVQGDGKQPRPKIRYNNTDLTLLSYIQTYDDLLGADLYKTITLSKYLDGQPEADHTKHRTERWKVERKSAQNKSFVEFELASEMDLEGRKIPNRVFIRRTCSRPYRFYLDGEWHQSSLSFKCPYSGASYFFRNGDVATNPEDDDCGKRLSDCELRFPNQPLPFGGFPGVGRGIR